MRLRDWGVKVFIGVFVVVLLHMFGADNMPGWQYFAIAMAIGVPFYWAWMAADDVERKRAEEHELAKREITAKAMAEAAQKEPAKQ